MEAQSADNQCIKHLSSPRTSGCCTLQNLFNEIQSKLDYFYQITFPHSHHLPLFPACRDSYAISVLVLMPNFDDLENYIDKKIENASKESEVIKKSIESYSKQLCIQCNRQDSSILNFNTDFLKEKIKKLSEQQVGLETEIESLQERNRKLVNHEYQPDDISAEQIEFEHVQCDHIIAVSSERGLVDQLTYEIKILEEQLKRYISSIIVVQPPKSPKPQRGERGTASPRWRRNNSSFEDSPKSRPNFSQAQLRQISLAPLDAPEPPQEVREPAVGLGSGGTPSLAPNRRRAKTIGSPS